MKSLKFIFSFVFFYSFLNQAQAQSEIKIDSRQPISLYYKASGWTGVENSVLVKDAQTGRSVKVEMTNKDLPAGDFQGTYTISWADADTIKPEIYDLKKNRLAYFYRKIGSLQRLELFSSGAQAESAFNDYKNRDDTKPFVEEGLKLFNQQKFQEAFEAFQKAESVDNTKKSYFLEYGISAFRKNDFTSAKRILSESLKSKDKTNEKNYFLGLTLNRAGDTQGALPYFQKVIASEDKTLAPPSSFFAGVTQFNDKNWKEAETSFQYTLDNSTDAEMDKAAEQYLDLIVKYRALDEEMSKKFLLTANLGLSFDTNILNRSTATLESSSASNLEGFRWNYAVGLLYRPVRREFWNAGISVGYSDLYSTNTSFAAESSFQNVDPVTLSLSLPYTLRVVDNTRTTQWNVAPFYETVNMNSDGAGAREPLVNSIGLRVFRGQSDSTRLGRMSVTQVSVQSDTSKVPLADSTTAGQLDPTGNRINLATKQSYLLDEKKSATWAYDLALGYNKAKGTDYTYIRPEAGVSLTHPGFWSSQLSVRLGYAIADYNEHSANRTDNVINLSAGLSRSLSKSFNFSTQLIQMFNSSNVSDYDYKRTIITAGLDYSLNF